MKKLEFKTGKGEFILLDMVGEESGMFLTGCLVDDNPEHLVLGYIIDMIEEHFFHLVDNRLVFQSQYVKDMLTFYTDYLNTESVLTSAKDSFKSLINSLGYYLFENPYKDPGLIPSAELDLYRRTNDKVFFNPILLKKI